MKLRITVEGKSYDVDVEVLDDSTPYTSPASRPAAAKATETSGAAAPPPSDVPQGDDEKAVRSPIAGVVLKVNVAPGDEVSVNQVVMVMEAMKMETNIASPIAGKVRTVHVKGGESVKQGQLLVEVE